MKRVFFMVGDDGEAGVPLRRFFDNEFAGVAAIWPVQEARPQQAHELASQKTKLVAVMHKFCRKTFAEDQIRTQRLNAVGRLASRRQ